jgi:hypothetical protein
MNARGITSLDYDLDGDLDLIVAQFLNSYRVFRNETNKTSLENTGWIKVHFAFPELGGRLILHRDGNRLVRPVTSRTDYASQQPATFHVGLGAHDRLDRLMIKDHGSLDSRTLEDLETGDLVLVGDDTLETLSKKEWQSFE